MLIVGFGRAEKDFRVGILNKTLVRVQLQETKAHYLGLNSEPPGTGAEPVY